MAKITAENLRSILSYDPTTGAFLWNYRPREMFATLNAYAVWNSRFAGKPAGGTKSRYEQIGIYVTRYQAHALAWLYMTGQWPNGEVDHINLDKQDNRFCNLRLASRKENGRNIKRYCTNKSGYKGVCWNKNYKKWQAQIRFDYGRKYLGLYENVEDAAAAYAKAAQKLHREFVRLK